MSLVDVIVPEVGESITEGVLVEWKHDTGDVVKVDDALFVLETDKVTMDISAESAGKLETLVEEGATVAIGQKIAVLDTAVSPAAKPAAQPAADSGGDGKAAPVTEQGVPQDGGPPTTVPTAGAQQARAKIAAMERSVRMTPVARRMVEEHGIDPAEVAGSGEGGRLTKADILGFLEDRAAAPAQPSSPPEVAKAAEQPAAPAVPPATETASPDQQPQTRQPMSPLRQRIAERLTQVQQTAAILTTFNEVDMTAVMNWRRDHKDEFQEKYGVKLGFMSFFVKATVEALKAVPELNSFIDGGEIVQNHYYDLGIAVSTERGLVVPVLRNPDRMGFAEIEAAIAELGRKAVERKLTLEDLQGGVFTISNGGIFGNLLSTPIINPPQSGILGMHAIKNRPVAVGDEIAIRPMMYLAVSYDHRIVDGREAVTFLKTIVNAVEDPRRLLLHG